MPSVGAVLPSMVTLGLGTMGGLGVGVLFATAVDGWFDDVSPG